MAEAEDWRLRVSRREVLEAYTRPYDPWETCAAVGDRGVQALELVIPRNVLVLAGLSEGQPIDHAGPDRDTWCEATWQPLVTITLMGWGRLGSALLWDCHRAAERMQMLARLCPNWRSLVMLKRFLALLALLRHMPWRSAVNCAALLALLCACAAPPPPPTTPTLLAAATQVVGTAQSASTSIALTVSAGQTQVSATVGPPRLRWR